MTTEDALSEIINALWRIEAQMAQIAEKREPVAAYRCQCGTGAWYNAEGRCVRCGGLR